MPKKSPVTLVCDKFNCTEVELAALLGVVISAISNWKARRQGRFPEVHYRKLLKEARKRKVELTLEEIAGI